MSSAVMMGPIQVKRVYVAVNPVDEEAREPVLATITALRSHGYSVLVTSVRGLESPRISIDEETYVGLDRIHQLLNRLESKVPAPA